MATITDGNGNQYEVGPTLLFYRPISTEQSSSGLYSGGEPGVYSLLPDQRQLLLAIMKKGVLRTDEHAQMREMGTWQVRAEKTILLKRNSKTAQELNTLLQKIKMNERRIPITYSISRDESPWNGMTDTAEQEERNRTIQARSSDALKGYEPIDATYLKMQRRPLLFRSVQKKEVVVSNADFSSLIRADATRITPGEEVAIGRALKDELLDPAFLLPFLLKGQILITYWHTDSEIRLTGESASNGRICYEFKGEHHYYTNEKNTEPLSFAVCVDAKSGQISVVGRQEG